MRRHGFRNAKFRGGRGLLSFAPVFAFVALFVFVAIRPAFAGNTDPWRMTLSDPATGLMEDVVRLNDFLLTVMTGIALLVVVLMVFVVVRFSARRNPVPSKTSHNVPMEVVWTVVPILIVVAIAVPSLRLLYDRESAFPEADVTVKATGYQWYWRYSYPDHGGFGFDSIMLADHERGDAPRLLATDTSMVVPVGAVVRVVVTSADVIHSWAVPSFGVKIDAVPGRLNETWFKASKTGTYYGQCSELCGEFHAFRPIKVDVVSPDTFDAWVARAASEDGYVALTPLVASDAVSAPTAPSS